MKQVKKLFSPILTLIIFISLSFNPVYANDKNNKDIKYVIPIGNVISINTNLDALIVKNSSLTSPLSKGDKIFEVNDKKVQTEKDFYTELNKIKNKKVNIKISKNNKIYKYLINKEILEDTTIIDNINACATLTYIDPLTKEYGAVAHSLKINSKEELNVKDGSIFNGNNMKIDKSKPGKVGSVKTSRNEKIGIINKSMLFGLKGKITNFNFSKMKKYKVASFDEIQLGQAYALFQDEKGEIKKHEIEVYTIEEQNLPSDKTFGIKIVSKKLLKQTGGIVQGMSGTPIIQGDKIIGAISHAITSNPKLGCAVYIKWMLES